MNFAKKSSVSPNALIPSLRVSTAAPLTPTGSPLSPAHVAVTTYRPAFLYKPQQYSTTPSPRVSYAQPNINNVFIKHHGDPLLHGPSVFGGNSIDDNYLQPTYDVTSRYIPPSELNNALASSSERYQTPSKVFEPPLKSDLLAHGIVPVGIASSTPPPISITAKNLVSVSPLNEPSYSTTPRPSAYYSSSTSRPSGTYYPSSTVRSSTPYYPSTTARPVSVVDNYVSPVAKPYTAKPDSYYSKGYSSNPIDYYNQAAAKGYRPYDGVSVTNQDGFKYFLPRQYHEEQGTNDVRDGSFGYIDPFGIRRVIYYNVRPGSGFRHRKNNRYVGFNATPYDPRPAHK